MGHVNGGERRLVVDFSRLDFISSSGMRVLLVAAKTLKDGEGTLVLCSMKDHIEEVFRISGFDQNHPHHGLSRIGACRLILTRITPRGT